MPFVEPGGGAVLGTDRLGRDVLSHLLTGGTQLLVVSGVIAVAVTVLSAVLGAVAAVRPRAGSVIELAGDLVILLPAVLGILLVLTAWPQGGVFALILVSLLFGVPYCARIFAAAASTIATSGYVEAAIAGGESLPYLVFREILPNLRSVFTTQLGLRFVVGVYLVSTVSFLGLPALDDDNWANMVRDNASGLLLNPWAVLAPSAAIAVVAVGVNLVVTGGSGQSRSGTGATDRRAATRTADPARATTDSETRRDANLAEPDASAFGPAQASDGSSDDEGPAAMGNGRAGSESRAGAGHGRVGGEGHAAAGSRRTAGERRAAAGRGRIAGVHAERHGRRDDCGISVVDAGDAAVIEGLTVVADTGAVLLAPLSFRLKAGTVTALTGPSGAGKSTAMRALLGHLPAGASQEGAVLVAGQEVFALDSRALRTFRRTRIAYVGQDPGSELNPLLRVRALLAEAAPTASDADRRAALELVGLDATHLRRRCGRLSGGQQRRVALARAFLRRPEVLVLDEPLAGLHGALRTDIARLIADLAVRESTAVLLSGHDTTTVHAIADTVVEVHPPGGMPVIDEAGGVGSSDLAIADTIVEVHPPGGIPVIDEAGAAGSSESETALACVDKVGVDGADEDTCATEGARPQPRTQTATSPSRVDRSGATRGGAGCETGAIEGARPGLGTRRAASSSRADRSGSGAGLAVDGSLFDTVVRALRAVLGYAASDLRPGQPGTERTSGAAGHHSATESRANRHDGPTALRVNGISAVADGHEILVDIDFTVRAGEALAVVGPSGAGKTTLARVIAGLHTTGAGSLDLRGTRIPVGRRRRIKAGVNGIQLVTQNPLAALNPRRTVEQTLARPLRRIARVPKAEVGCRVESLLAAVELPTDLATRHPRELSGGQRQRVALARALAADPAVLICDEITTALDTATATAIMTLLDHLRADRGTTVLLISHDMALVTRHCTELLVLDHGRIVESGTPAAVLASPTHQATADLMG
ncbi:ATP-binding cassette domain-containing protein [Nocardia sp. NPDC058497]|uniref:ABC transporter ATP-binding protein/permease n=1 Tax=Nocardia sp. NPDC058497 TaxID=3346529 RepID=UPI00365C1955